MEKVKDKIMNTKILAAIGIACLIIGTFLPYVTIKFWGMSQSFALTHYWEGYVILVLAAANLLMIFKMQVEKYLPKIFQGKLGEMLTRVSNKKASLIPTGLVAALAIYLHTSVYMGSSYMKYGLGFYVILIGIIALAAYPFVYKGEE